MTLTLECEVRGDGRVGLKWRPAQPPQAYALLIHRTGARPSFTSLLLAGELEGYELSNLSRHQRYRLAVLVLGARTAASTWFSVTPRTGLAPKKETESTNIEAQIAHAQNLLVMPQDQRVTAFWSLSSGFVDKVVLELLEGEAVRRRIELEPEVRSYALVSSSAATLKNGGSYALRLSTRFTCFESLAPQLASFTPAAPGAERRLNQGHDRSRLLFPTAQLGAEVEPFGEEEPRPLATRTADVICAFCRRTVRWREHRLLCDGCGAEFVPNAAGDYLDVRQLRFGTCTCCQPKKILVQLPGTDSLICNSSGKEYVRLPGKAGHCLIEDLPYGLCQCCRPRQPLGKSGKVIRCQRSKEEHRSADGRFVLVPSAPVFDATAIAALMDAGLAEICHTGVHRGRR